MVIYKIFRRAEWDALVANGQTQGAPVDLADGYIHFSTAETVAETAAKHFAGETDLILASVEATGLGNDLKWEVSRGGMEFPHLYAPLKFSDVTSHSAIPSTAEGFSFEGLL